MWLQVIVELLNIIKMVLKAAGLYTDPTTKSEEE